MLVRGASPTLRVEGRRIGILSFRRSAGGTVTVTPMALMTVAERIDGLARYQIVQSSEKRLRVHVRAAEGCAEDAVWTALRDALARYHAHEGADGVAIDRADEPPRPDPVSGKFHKFRSEIG